MSLTSYPKVGDTYDTATKEHQQFPKEPRAKETTFSFIQQEIGVKTKKKRSLQGPHVFSHVASSGLYNRGTEIEKKDPKKLLGTKAILRPGAARRQMKDQMRFSKPADAKGIKEGLNKWNNEYEPLYKKAKAEEDSEEAKKAVRHLLELQPSTTYRNESGRATKKEMEGKGEREPLAIEQARSLYERIEEDTPRQEILDSITGMKSFDAGDIKSRHARRAAKEKVLAQIKFAFGGEVSGDETIESMDEEELAKSFDYTSETEESSENEDSEDEGESSGKEEEEEA